MGDEYIPCGSLSIENMVEELVVQYVRLTPHPHQRYLLSSLQALQKFFFKIRNTFYVHIHCHYYYLPCLNSVTHSS